MQSFFGLRLGSVLVGALLAATAASVSAAPTTPPAMRYATGVLVSWSATEARPLFTIRGASGAVTFAASRGLTIDGKAVICDPHAPTRHYTIVGCNDFPGDIHLGRTRVRVAYYSGTSRPIAQTITRITR